VSGRDLADWVRWAASAVLVVGAHAAAAAIIVNYADPVAPGTPAAAIVVDLAPIAAAPEDAQPDVAPGPLQQQVDGTPDVKPDQPVVDTPDKPVIAQEPVETRPEEKPVEVAVARIEPVEEKVETPPEKPKPQDQPLIEKVPEANKPDVTATIPVAQPPPPKRTKAARPMQLATAPMPAPQVDRRAVAPSQGMPSPTSKAAAQNWNSAISAALERAKRYPSDAKSRGEQGTAVVAFSIDRGGHVLSSRIARSSGHAALDQETLATVGRASLPPAPTEHPGARFSFSVPIRFNIR
jgi:periplasmic protein TonB